MKRNRIIPILVLVALFGVVAYAVYAYKSNEHVSQLVILHTDDVHSQVEPNNKNLGGYARMDEIVKHEIALLPDSATYLLLDAGDFCQGTPYFTIYNGRMEVEFMNRMGYEAATLGNHEFDNGLDSLAMLVRLAKFPIVCANYDFTGTPLEGLIKPYTIIKKGGLKIGIFGLGVSPESLIAKKKFGDIRFIEPIEVAQPTIDELRNKEKCDVVICLSHLGYENEDRDFSDEDLIAQTRGIDALIGGHTHKIITSKVANLDGDSIPVPQMKKCGVYVGKVVLDLK